MSTSPSPAFISAATVWLAASGYPSPIDVAEREGCDSLKVLCRRPGLRRLSVRVDRLDPVHQYIRLAGLLKRKKDGSGRKEIGEGLGFGSTDLNPCQTRFISFPLPAIVSNCASVSAIVSVCLVGMLSVLLAACAVCG